MIVEWRIVFTINYDVQRETILTGIVADQAALNGIISRLRDLGLQLSSVSSLVIVGDSHE